MSVGRAKMIRIPVSCRGTIVSTVLEDGGCFQNTLPLLTEATYGSATTGHKRMLRSRQYLGNLGSTFICRECQDLPLFHVRVTSGIPSSIFRSLSPTSPRNLGPRDSSGATRLSVTEMDESVGHRPAGVQLDQRKRGDLY
jgi:hypothetical protein